MNARCKERRASESRGVCTCPSQEKRPGSVNSTGRLSRLVAGARLDRLHTDVNPLVVRSSSRTPTPAQIGCSSKRCAGARSSTSQTRPTRLGKIDNRVTARRAPMTSKSHSSESSGSLQGEDLEEHVIDMNHEAGRAYGWQRDELLGQPIHTIVPEERHAPDQAGRGHIRRPHAVAPARRPLEPRQHQAAHVRQPHDRPSPATRSGATSSRTSPRWTSAVSMSRSAWLTPMSAESHDALPVTALGRVVVQTMLAGGLRIPR
jgi:hypothetical protein